MEDGATPLIMAARLAVEGMVEDLINADADINAADDYGKQNDIEIRVGLYCNHLVRLFVPPFVHTFVKDISAFLEQMILYLRHVFGILNDLYHITYFQEWG